MTEDRPAYALRRDNARAEALAQIHAQVAAGTLTVRKLTADDLASLERARSRRLDPVVIASVAPDGVDDQEREQ